MVTFPPAGAYRVFKDEAGDDGNQTLVYDITTIQVNNNIAVVKNAEHLTNKQKLGKYYLFFLKTFYW